ncbi:hypothetical protein ACOMHN_050900 [Nucella lapillus]
MGIPFRFGYDLQRSMTCLRRTRCILPLLLPAGCIKRLQVPSVCRQHGRLWSSAATNELNDNNKVSQYLQARIKANGPITVAEYMKTVLTSAESGYYMHRDVFGSKGDFITSPEISQMFGEMLGVWCVNEWNNLCAGQPVQLVELGPGRGTLAEDLLRVFSQFADMKDMVTLHLVEISPALSQMQAQRLSGSTEPTDLSSVKEGQGHGKDGQGHGEEGQGLGPYRREMSKYGVEVFWYRSLEDVPKGLSVYMAHEFLDALPIHKFQKTEKGWCEVLIDLKKDSSSEQSPFRFVLSPGKTPASSLLQVVEGEGRDHMEVCPLAGQTVQEVAQRIRHHGGFGLFVDYGHSGEKGDTFRAFKQHELHDPLVGPGSADLTADVDFAYLKRYAQGVSMFGPITQQDFLVNMGIGVRLQMLLQKAKQEQWKSLLTGYDMLTHPAKMGERFKFLSLMNPPNSEYVPAGFHRPDFLNTQF